MRFAKKVGCTLTLSGDYYCDANKVWNFGYNIHSIRCVGFIALRWTLWKQITVRLRLLHIRVIHQLATIMTPVIVQFFTLRL